MAGDARLREKLRKIEALFAGAGTEGERLAAEAALGRIRARLAEMGRSEAPVEIQFAARPWCCARQNASSTTCCGPNSRNSTPICALTSKR